MTRRGKIARLPRDIRDQVNRRLENGLENKQIVEWLNTLPEVQSIMAAEFDAQPVNEPNLSHWKTGGYQDWLQHQESLEATRQFVADAAELTEAAGGDLTEKLAVCLAARLAQALQNIPSAADNPEAHLETLRRLILMLSKLRKANHDAQMQQIRREELALSAKKFKADNSLKKRRLKLLEPDDRGPITEEGWKQIEHDLKLL